MARKRKKKYKELLFDINHNELIELDENGNPVKEDEVLLDREDILKEPIENLDYELHEEKEYLVGGKEKLDILLSKSTDEVEDKFKKTKEFAKQTSKKAKNTIDSVTKNVKPVAGNLSKGIKSKFSAIVSSIKNSCAKLSARIKKDGFKKFAKDNAITLTVAIVIIVFGGGYYIYSYRSLPELSDTHESSNTKNYKNYSAEVHPMQILSTVTENMEEFKGSPTSKGKGNSADTRFVSYSLEWFGKKRKTVMFYNTNHQFNRIKLEINNESATDIYKKLNEELGLPIDEKNPTVRKGYAVWIKDAIKYKMLHRGTYATIDMSLAMYDNPSKLSIGKYPVIIQYIKTVDLNGDGKTDEKILILGNKADGITTNFAKLYLLVWDGTKTYLQEMEEGYDGGSFPQIKFVDMDGDQKDEIIISAENNVVTLYNQFKYTGSSVERKYSGNDEPTKDDGANSTKSDKNTAIKPDNANSSSDKNNLGKSDTNE